jgi:hypothetical protein
MTLTGAAPPDVADNCRHEPTKVLFPEARRRRRYRRLIFATSLVAAAGVTAALFAFIGGSPPRRPGAPVHSDDGRTSAPVPTHVVLRGNGIGAAHFGQPEAVAVIDLEHILGTPLSAAPISSRGCTIDSQLTWPVMTAYFDRGRFVGYGTGGAMGRYGHHNFPGAVTAQGLKIGDSVAQAQAVYGNALTMSYAQGGS